MKWITRYIEENKATWEENDRKREEEAEMRTRIEGKDEGQEMKKTEVRQPTIEEIKERRLEQAKRMKESWRQWRSTLEAEEDEEPEDPEKDETERQDNEMESKDEDEEPTEKEEKEEPDKVTGTGNLSKILFPGTDQAGLQGQDNSSLAKEGAYEEIPPRESIAPWDACLLADLGGERRPEQEGKDKKHEEGPHEEEEQD